MRSLPDQSNLHIQAPFQCRLYPDLIGELAIDDIFRRSPATERDANEIGRLYRSFDPKDPFASIEKILSLYSGPSERYYFGAARFRSSAQIVHFVMEGNSMLRVPVDAEGLFDYFFQSVKDWLVESGVSPTDVMNNLLPPPLPEGEGQPSAVTSRWVIGCERSTSNLVIFDSKGPNGGQDCRGFLAGSNSIRAVALPNLKRNS